MGYKKLQLESYFPDEEITRYGFISHMESYIKDLLQHPENAERAIRFTPLQITTFVSPVQSKNAEEPISTTLPGIVILLSPTQSLKAKGNSFSTLHGIVTLVRLRQPENAD